MATPPPRVLLFDGDCNFCRAIVRWIIEHDPHRRIHFAPLQSEPGRRLLESHGLPGDYAESVVLIDDQTRYMNSEAVLRVMRVLERPWRSLGRVGLWFPRSLRDWGYRRVSYNRSTLSEAVGTIDHRWEPPPHLRDRFLAY